MVAVYVLSYTQILADPIDLSLIKNNIKKKIERQATKEKFRCSGELICGLSQIPLFYQRRGFSPAWCSSSGILPQAESLITKINSAYTEGLRPDAYHLPIIMSLLEKIEKKQSVEDTIDPELLADFDLLLTDAFMLYGSHLLAGRVNPEILHTDWKVAIPTADLINILQSALHSNQIKKTLKGLRPSHAGYTGLKKYLAHYRNIAKEAHRSSLLSGTGLRKDDKGPSVQYLRKRLIIFGDLNDFDKDQADLFDEAVEAAVLRFQKRHGLKQDGIVGPRTLEMLNTPIHKRIRQIELNMERWRWVPRDLGNRYLVVNIADFKLWVTENRRRALEMRVVVGRPYRRTPVFSTKMTYMVINPYWNIPQSLAIKDVLPKIQKDVGYIEQQRIKVFKDWRNGAVEIDPDTIAWDKIEGQNFTYKLRQDPGPRNPLGRVKFIFPNKFAVYLHDTPKRLHFKETNRNFSSGCIRTEKPIDLAVYLLKNDPEWTREKLMDAIENGSSKVIQLQSPIAVHLEYWTAWVDETGGLNFRSDIYDRDGPLDRALKERFPEA